jgi:thiol-disulfide isomerase/thioredoxin
MKHLAAVASFACFAYSSLALAGPYDKPGLPLGDVLRAAADAKKPVLLDFGAVWCVPCRMLDEELHKPELADAVAAFAVTRYDAERGEGAKAAERYKVVAFPTLIVVDGAGNELARLGGFDPDGTGKWLRRWSAVATSDAAAAAQLAKTPDDVHLLWAMATRAEARHDDVARRRWLGRIEAADKTPPRAEAAEAAWQRLTLDVRDRVNVAVRPLLVAYAHAYPARAGLALALAAEAGADKATVDAELRRAADAATGDALNELVYHALAAGAFDAALYAAERQRKLSPDDTNVLDTLAEVHHYRGEHDRAIALEKEALAKMPGNPSLTANLARFEKRGNDPSPDVNKPSLVGELLPDDDRFDMPPSPPAELAKRQFAHESARVVAGCGKAWPAELDEAYVRITLGRSPHAEAVELLEPHASAAFRKCVTAAVKAIELPADSPAVRFVVGFKHTPPPALMPR